MHHTNSKVKVSTAIEHWVNVEVLLRKYFDQCERQPL